jgi:hypothetical protein
MFKIYNLYCYLIGDNEALMVGYRQREPGFSNKFIVLQINTKVAAGLQK